MSQGFQFVWPIVERRAVSQWFTTHKVMLEDWRPVWKGWIPNVRRRHLRTFERQADPFTGQAWTPLTPAYAKWKQEHFGLKPILTLTGALKNAASRKGATGQIIVMRERFMAFGVDLGRIYPRVHQATDRMRKDGKQLRRSWLGLKIPEDFVSLTLHAQKVWSGKLDKVAKGAPGVGRGSA